MSQNIINAKHVDLISKLSLLYVNVKGSDYSVPHQPGQHLCYLHIGSNISKHVTSEISYLSLALKTVLNIVTKTI